jgi:hypothetical protein
LNSRAKMTENEFLSNLKKTIPPSRIRESLIDNGNYKIRLEMKFKTFSNVFVIIAFIFSGTIGRDISTRSKWRGTLCA